MKIANSIKITVFAKEEEDFDKIKAKLLSLIPFSLEEEKVKLKESSATGFSEKKIKIFEVLLEKDRHIEAFLDNLVKELGDETKELILKQAENRLDEECNFFLRFGKDKLMKEKELWVTDQGNCFHIKMNIACFPRKREKALEVIFNIFRTY